MNEFLLKNDFEKQIPIQFKNLISVEIAKIPLAFESLINAFGTAINCIENKVDIKRKLLIIFSAEPFIVNLSNGRLEYHPKNSDIINLHLEDILIFIDCNKTIKYPFEQQVACILEEIVHSVMSITDEQLVSNVVELLYSKIEVKDGKYFIKN